MSATAPALQIGGHRVDPPVVLAPMAGITNVAFRMLCREFGSPGALYVCEMITTRALVERDRHTMHMISFDPGEHPRSMQLYGVDPGTTGQAVRMIVDEDLADHIDLNFGCPMPKITKRGGGAAIPYKRKLFAAIVAAAVRAAEPAGIPVTVKFRIGIDEEHHTCVDGGKIAESEGAAAVALHARTAAQRYSGKADWSAIAALKAAVHTIPVLGNGDIFAPDDALRMLDRTGCDGIVVGRGCLGRPWLFAELADVFAGRPPRPGPRLGDVANIMYRHAQLLVEHYRSDGFGGTVHDAEFRGVRDLRKHMSWYLHGFPVGSQLRQGFGLVSSLCELSDLLGKLDPDAAFPSCADGPRGRQGSPARVMLPEGWLNDPDDYAVPAGEDMHSGG